MGINAECFYQRWIVPEILRVGVAERRKAADLIQSAFNNTFPTLPDGRDDGAEGKLLLGDGMGMLEVKFTIQVPVHEDGWSRDQKSSEKLEESCSGSAGALRTRHEQV